MKKNYIFLLYFLVCFSISYGQLSSKDSLNLTLVKQYKGVNNDSLLFYSKQLQKSKDSCILYSGKIYQALALYNKNDFNASEQLAKTILKELEKSKKIQLLKIKIESLNRLFWIHKNQQKYNDAYTYLLETKDVLHNISQDSSYYQTISLSNQINTALIKNLLGYQKEARKILFKTLNSYYLKNLTIDKEHDLYSKILNQTSIYNIIGESYLKSSENYFSKHLDSASFYLKKAFELAKTFNPPHQNSETLYQLREAEVLIARNKIKEALTLIQKFDTNAKEYKTAQNIYFLKTICFYNLNLNDSTLYFGNKFLDYQNKSPKTKKSISVIYDILANQYHKNKQIDSAFKYSELTLLALKDLHKNKNEVHKSNHLYDFGNAEKLNKAVQKKYKSTKMIFIIAVVIVFMFAAFILFFFYKKSKKNTLKFHKINNQPKEILTTQKTTYNLDKALELELLKGLESLENSTEYLATSFNINALAKQLHTNTSYLSYTINKSKNKSFKQYITDLRIEYLLKKLQEDKNYRKYTIKYLAEEIGYTNASAFTRAFKKHKGVTPSEYIKSL
ncbi:helix-turn-helix domain-containing protein [Polaribacter sp.]|uniref:helix-turn-helix domain-containing protein n=1 Tax=Polaribacter sp. TaxID=1920175 RepID=UPI003EF3537B